MTDCMFRIKESTTLTVHRSYKIQQVSTILTNGKVYEDLSQDEKLKDPERIGGGYTWYYRYNASTSDRSHK